MAEDDFQIDNDRVLALAALLGPNRLLEFLDRIRLRLERLAVMAEDLPQNRTEFQAIVHQTCGSASSMGLKALEASLHKLAMGLRLPNENTALIVELLQYVREQFVMTQKALVAILADYVGSI